MRGTTANPQMKDAQSQACPRLLVAVLLLVARFPLVPALAGGIVDEVKAGVLAHDIGFLGDPVEGGADIVAEVLFKSRDFLQVIGAPRPTIGSSVNTNGKADYLYFDMTWTATVWQPIAQQGGIYVGGFLGGAVHDGRLVGYGTNGNKDLGTRALFHLGAEAGYHITPVYSVEAYFSHLSNAHTSSHNPGLNNVGVRAGFRF
jgi:lipid A 3-O-deacylase